MIAQQQEVFNTLSDIAQEFRNQLETLPQLTRQAIDLEQIKQQAELNILQVQIDNLEADLQEKRVERQQKNSELYQELDAKAQETVKRHHLPNHLISNIQYTLQYYLMVKPSSLDNLENDST